MNTALDQIAFRATANLSAVEVGLRGIPNDDPNGSFLETVMNRVKQGKARVFEILARGEIVGFTVYETENFGEHKEFISVATHCPHTANIRAEIEQELINHAKSIGCKSIRMHTARHGLIREATAHGWHVAEVVLRKSIP